jgi:sec-independent protein translocase protein TatA
MFGIGFWELLVVLVVVLLIFGNRLPAIARSLGRSLVEFKRGTHEIDDQSENKTDHLK